MTIVTIQATVSDSAGARATATTTASTTAAASTKDFVADFGAPTNGIFDALPAANRWITYARANPGSTLTIPRAGTLVGQPQDYHFSSVPSLISGSMGNVTITGTGGGQVILDAWGGCFPSAGSNPSNGSLEASKETSGYIATVAAGSNTVTLRTPSDASKFRVGRWVIVNGLAIQGLIDPTTHAPLGYPPNWHRFEYQLVTGIDPVAGVITFSAPLRYAYSQTWGRAPAALDPLSTGFASAQGGPGQICALTAEWDVAIAVNNIKVLGNAAWNSVSARWGDCRQITCTNCAWPSTATGYGWAPSIIKDCIINSTDPCTNPNFSCEIDKLIDHVEFNNCIANNGAILFQSSSVREFIATGSTIGILVGTPRNTTLSNSKIGSLQAGVGGYGACDSFTTANSTINSVSAMAAGFDGVPPNGSNSGSIWTYMGHGIFRSTNTILGGLFDVNNLQVAVPGYQFMMANRGSGFMVTPDASYVRFCVTDVYDDGVYLYLKTTMPDPLPRPTFFFGSNGPNYYWRIAFKAITEMNLTGVSVRNFQDVGATPNVFLSTVNCPG